MIEPLQSDEALLADIAGASEDPAVFHLWWLGQSGFLIRWRRQGLLLDPYLSDSLTRKYALTDKPHVRMTRRVVDPGRLGPIAVVTASHHHTDHLDAETLRPLAANNPGLEMVFPEAHRALVDERLGAAAVRRHGLDDGGEIACGPFHITALASAHEAIERDDAGRCLYLGYAVRFGSWTIYHSGDTVRYAGLAERLRGLAIDVALLPINGRAPERRVAGNLSGPEAAALAKDMGARLVIPCHYEMFTFNTASPGEFEAAAASLGQPYCVLKCGEFITWEQSSHVK